MAHYIKLPLQLLTLTDFTLHNLQFVKISMRLMTLYDFYQQIEKRRKKWNFFVDLFLFGEQKHFFPFRYMIFSHFRFVHIHSLHCTI